VDALRLSEARYRTLVTNLPDTSVFLYDHDLRYVLLDGASLAAVGLSKEALEGRTIWEFLPADLCERLAPRHRAALEGQVITYEDVYNDHIYAVQLLPIRDARGAIIYGMGVAVDVTERKRAEDALRESETRLRTIIEAEPECVKLLDREGRLLEMNPAGLAMIEADGIEQVRGTPIVQVVAPEHRAAFSDLNRRVLAGASGTLEFEIIGLKGTHRWLATHAVPLRDAAGAIQAVLGITRDVTQRKAAEEQLRESRAALRRLAARQQDVREKERTRIAREIHDTLGQSLTALKLELAAAWEASQRGQPGLAARLSETTRLVDDLVKSVRRIATELRPPILDELGLPAAVEWFARDFARRTGIVCETIVTLRDEALGDGVATGLFRILQEALTNVSRHADARRVVITLALKSGVVTLEVVDDGRGITESEATGPRSVGILGMRERATALGGVLEVGPAPRGGTRVAAWCAPPPPLRGARRRTAT
jgi:PAS domain S-box-containing protein